MKITNFAPNEILKGDIKDIVGLSPMEYDYLMANYHITYNQPTNTWIAEPLSLTGTALAEQREKQSLSSATSYATSYPDLVIDKSLQSKYLFDQLNTINNGWTGTMSFSSDITEIYSDSINKRVSDAYEGLKMLVTNKAKKPGTELRAAINGLIRLEQGSTKA
jgi:hypothetical protein